MAANTGCSHNKLKDTSMQQKENMVIFQMEAVLGYMTK